MARNSVNMSLELSGMDNIERWITGLDLGLQSKLLMGAMQRAAKPMIASAKSMAPKRTGALRRSIDAKVVEYKKDGVIVGIIGPKNMRVVEEEGKGGRKRLRKAVAGDKQSKIKNPAKYAHLVEFGHRSVHGGGALPNYGEKVKGVWNSVNKGKSIRKGTIKATSFVAPRPFMRPAFERHKDQMMQALELGVLQAIAAETKRINRSLSKKKITVKIAA